MKIHVAAVEHKHGTTSFAAWSPTDLDASIAKYCHEWWEKDGLDEPMPESDREIIDQYFGWIDEIGGSESLIASETPLWVRAGIGRHQRIFRTAFCGRTPRAAACC
jgi:hypothetical protein